MKDVGSWENNYSSFVGACDHFRSHAQLKMTSVRNVVHMQLFPPGRYFCVPSNIYDNTVQIKIRRLLQSFVGLFDTNCRQKLHFAEGNGIMG